MDILLECGNLGTFAPIMSEAAEQSPLPVLVELYHTSTGHAVDAIEPLAQDGSTRRYWRLRGSDGGSLVGCYGREKRENEAFVYLSQLLSGVGVNVPRVTGVAADGLEYLQTDLGNKSLYDLIAEHGAGSPDVKTLVDATMAELAKAHWCTVGKVDFSRCYPRAAMDARSVMWDLNYFKYCFLKPLGVVVDEELLQNDFDSLCAMLSSDGGDVLMLRDFQSRNIMVHDGKPWIIDFQGARRGPAAYDVASFAWQSRAGFSDAMRGYIAESYKRHAMQYELFDSREFDTRYPLCVLVRLLQVLGAYGLRGLIERKSKFITPLPKSVALLKEVIDANDWRQLPYLSALLRDMCEMPQLQPQADRSELVVEVSSFSYKKGVPVDNSGNGGGFVFDCRAVHNPGRYDRYKPLTGLDKPVIEFLESTPEMGEFLESAYALVDHSVERYLQRGFTHLCAHFGCTGGRHRSVYSAQHLAQHLSDKYGVEVHLSHREQGIDQIFPKR